MDNPNKENYNFKIVLLGEGAVGKTSLLLRYVEDKFNDKHVCTIQASFLVKKLNISGKRVNLSIWDTAGQEKFHALGPIYYRMSNGAVLVYDITDDDSFKKVKCWVKELKKMLGDDVSLFIVGNKIDLDEKRAVSTEEARSYAAEVGANFVETSAKLNDGVDLVFRELCKMILQRAAEERKSEVAIHTSSLRRSVLVVDDEVTDQNLSEHRSRCCGGSFSH